MNVAQHADRILAAWRRADPARFEQELENAMQSCRFNEPENNLECEQLELLESVVERLRAAPRERLSQPRSGQGLHAGFALLEHLRHRAAA